MDGTGYRANACHGCGYDLTGIVPVEHMVRCPECGLTWDDGLPGVRIRPWPGNVWIAFLMTVPAWWMHLAAILLVFSPFSNPIALLLGAWAFSMLGILLFGMVLFLWPFMVSDWIVQRYVHPARRRLAARWLLLIGFLSSIAMFGAAYLTLAIAAQVLFR